MNLRCGGPGGVLPRLETFVKPFVEHLSAPEHRRHAAEYVTGLMSKLERKTGAGIAYLLDQERQGIQKFIGEVPWDHQPMLKTLAAQVGRELGEPDGVIVFDPSGFPKKGTKSVGSPSSGAAAWARLSDARWASTWVT